MGIWKTCQLLQFARDLFVGKEKLQESPLRESLVKEAPSSEQIPHPSRFEGWSSGWILAPLAGCPWVGQNLQHHSQGSCQNGGLKSKSQKGYFMPLSGPPRAFVGCKHPVLLRLRLLYEAIFAPCILGLCSCVLSDAMFTPFISHAQCTALSWGLSKSKNQYMILCI